MHSAPPSWPGTVAAVPRSLEGHSEAAAVRAPVTGPFFAVREIFKRDPKRAANRSPVKLKPNESSD